MKIVAYGPGLPMLNAKTTKSDMYAGIGYVGSGVTHIMKRQKEGWAYIRP